MSRTFVSFNMETTMASCSPPSSIWLFIRVKVYMKRLSNIKGLQRVTLKLQIYPLLLSILFLTKYKGSSGQLNLTQLNILYKNVLPTTHQFGYEQVSFQYSWFIPYGPKLCNLQFNVNLILVGLVTMFFFIRCDFERKKMFIVNRLHFL